ncbi:TetR/AcrR family transcriptional regulator [Marinomonas communis]|uniref:TetR/AcrR family transcriptional regulator n=1 Tax=Marinomonas communis TaxID=28254 RepID=UPI001FD4E3B9|nr:helix-turn-helix domain-containing protein [Marinomonas communis]
MTKVNRREQQKANTRAKIKTAARKAFHEFGIEATTTREISRLSNVAVGTFFVHYADKLELVKEIYFDDMDEALSSSVGQLAPTSSPAEYLIQIAKILFPFYSDYIESTRHIVADSINHGGFHTQQMQSISQGVSKRFADAGIDTKTAQLFAENMMANYWLVFMECLPKNEFSNGSVIERLEGLNLPFKISFENALQAKR